MPAAVKRSAGYSGTPLPQKLGLAEGRSICLIGAPPGYRKSLAPLPDGVRFAARVSAETDIVQLFVTRRSDLERRMREIFAVLRADAALWVSWPKKSAGVATDVTEDVVRALALPLGLVDVKVCAVDEVWSGLKLVIRKSRRAGR